MADDEALESELMAAEEAYYELLGRYGDGRFDEGDFRKGVIEKCVLIRDDEAWFFDGTLGRWLHYDGVAVRLLGEDRDPIDGAGGELVEVVLVDPGHDRVGVLRALRELTGL